MTKIVIHSVIVSLMDEIIVKINYSPFSGDPLAPPQGPLVVPGTHFDNYRAKPFSA